MLISYIIMIMMMFHKCTSFTMRTTTMRLPNGPNWGRNWERKPARRQARSIISRTTISSTITKAQFGTKGEGKEGEHDAKERGMKRGKRDNMERFKKTYRLTTIGGKGIG